MTDAHTAALIARYYRWWTLKLWRGPHHVGVKLGPLSVFGYRWLDVRWRLSWTWRCGDEHVIAGGPLASQPRIVDTDRTTS